MFKYQHFLSSSEEMKHIPEHWIMGIPIICQIQKQYYVAVICYSVDLNKKVTVKELLLVDINSGNVNKMNAEEISKTFLNSNTFRISSEEYDKDYYEIYDCYKEVVNEICNSIRNGNNIEKTEYIRLLKKLIPAVLCENIYNPIGKSFCEIKR